MRTPHATPGESADRQPLTRTADATILTRRKEVMTLISDRKLPVAVPMSKKADTKRAECPINAYLRNDKSARRLCAILILA